MKAQFILVFLISGFQSYAQIGAKVNSGADIKGTWYNNDLGYQMVLVFREQGVGELDGEIFQYKTESDKVHITSDARIVTYTFSLHQDVLSLSGGDIVSGTIVKFARSPGENSMNTSQNTMGQKSSGDIIGVWSSNGETIEFQSGGQCLYLGQAFTYKLSPGKVTLSTTQGDIAFDYIVNGELLTISINGNSVMYTRGSGQTQNQSQQHAGSGAVDMNLVGKWCYVDVSNVYGSSSSSSSTCITLNADGTYEYYGETSRSVNTPDLYGGTSSQSSDRGTWYVSGDRIYYSSPTQGTGSYKLEKRNHPKNVNDPMIILDGAAYVSFYNKPPWR